MAIECLERLRNRIKSDASFLMASILILLFLLKISLLSGTPLYDSIQCNITGLDPAMISAASRNPMQVINPLRFEDPTRPPAYHLVVSLSRAFFGEVRFPGSVWFIQLFLSTFTAWMVFLIARELYGIRVAFISGLIMALYPAFLIYSFMLFTDVLFVFFLTLVFHRVILQPKLMSLRNTLYTGFLAGIWVMIRIVPLFFIPVLGMWLAWLQRHDARKALTHFTGFIVMSSMFAVPWSVAASYRFHRVVVVTPHGIVVPLSLGISQPDVGEMGGYVVDFMTLDKEMLSKKSFCAKADTGGQDMLVCTLKELVVYSVEDPGWAFARFYRKVKYLFAPYKYPRGLLWLGCGIRSNAVSYLVYLVSSVTYGLALLLAIVGLGSISFSRSSPQEKIIFLFIIYVIAVHGLTAGWARYRLPIEPFIIMYAARALASPAAAVRQLFRPTIKNAILSVLVLFFAFFLADQVLFITELYRIRLPW